MLAKKSLYARKKQYGIEDVCSTSAIEIFVSHQLSTEYVRSSPNCHEARASCNGTVSDVSEGV